MLDQLANLEAKETELLADLDRLEESTRPHPFLAMDLGDLSALGAEVALALEK